jgi:2-C-methyl-D-erythritol 4-phosphate cytidylyltransferase
MSPVLGLVPVLLDDPEAPHGCSALRALRRTPLLGLAARALAASGVVHEILVLAPAGALDAVTAAVHPGNGIVRVVAVPEPDCRELLATVRHGLPADRVADVVVVLHDARAALAPPDLVRSVVGALRDDPDSDAVVPARELTDTVKWVGADGRVLATPDRTAFRVLSTPQAYRAAALEGALDRAPDAGVGRAGGPEVLPALLRATGGRVRALGRDSDVPWLAGPTDLLLAEALPESPADAIGDDEPDPVPDAGA